jgi:hypothetical protein
MKPSRRREIGRRYLDAPFLQISFSILISLGTICGVGHVSASWWKKSETKSYRDWGQFVEPTRDGGYVIAGTIYSLGGWRSDVILIKIDVRGKVLWTRTLGGGEVDWGHWVRQTADGGYVIAGTTWRSEGKRSDVYLVKTGPDGREMWSKSFGGEEREHGLSVFQTHDGGYVIAGDTNSSGAGKGDVYLIRTDPRGNRLWSRTFGGKEKESGTCVQETRSGGYVICGSTASFGAGGEDIYLIRTNRSGKTLWTRTYGDIYDDSGGCVQQTPDGGFVLGGTWGRKGRSSDVYLAKTDEAGNTIWSEVYG